MPKVKFITPIKAKEGTPLLKVAKKANISIKTSCEKGKCGKCIVKVKGELSPPTRNEIKSLGEDKIKKGYRLACEVTVIGDADISVPCKTK
jgi:ferredoxin